MKRLATLALIAVLLVMYAHAIVLNYEARKLISVSHWGIDCTEGMPIYRGPTGKSKTYQSEYDWFRRAPLQWYTAREDAPTWEP